jgi:hypothetical protein
MDNVIRMFPGFPRRDKKKDAPLESHFIWKRNFKTSKAWLYIAVAQGIG